MQDRNEIRNKIIGLGEESSRKSYYPELQRKLTDLQRFRDLLDFSNEGIVQAKLSDLSILEINEPACSLFGKQKSDLLKCTINDIFTVEQIELINEKIRVGSNNNDFRFSANITKDDGAEIDLEISFHTALLDGESFLVFVLRDVSEMVAVEKQIAQSEENLRTVFNTALDAIIVHHADGNIIDVNEAMLALYEIDREEINNYTISDYTAEGTSEEEIAKRMRLSIELGGIVFEWKARKPKSGEVFEAEVALNRSNWNGETVLVAIVRDITERKNLERALEEKIIALTMPTADVRGFKFQDVFSAKEMQEIQDSFARACSVSSIIIDPEGHPITQKSLAEGFCASLHCDHHQDCISGWRQDNSELRDEVECSVCNRGLCYEGGTPIKIGNQIIAHWLIGEAPREDIDLGKFQELVSDKMPNEWEAEYYNTNFFSKARFESVLKALQVFAKQISTLATQNIQQAVDISARQNAEAALLENEKKLLSYIESAPDGVVIMDRAGAFTRVNRAMLEITGYESGQFMRKRFSELFDPENAISAEDLKSELKSNFKFVRELRARRSNGDLYYISVSFVRLSDGSLLGFCRDVTERVNAQKEIESLNQVLEERVRDRTNQLENAYANLRAAHEEIAKTLDKERELSEMKSRFISTVSHEYRTPLTGIMTSTFLLENFFASQDKDNFDKYLKRIQNQIGYMSRMLEDVLFVGKSDAGRIEKSTKDFDLVEFFNDLIPEIRMLDGNRHTIELVSPKDSIVINHDEKLFLQMFSNLLSNACKYSEDGKSVTAQIEKCDSLLVISITDEGIGIPQHEQKMMFEPFHRFSNVGAISGTGLGLSVVKRCADIVGATLDVESYEGIGTKVSISIPL